MLSIVRSNYNFAKNAEFYEGDVSCIEVQSGYIMIRQNGTTFLTGNCPRPLVSLSGDKDQTVNDKRWIEFKENVKSILENYDFFHLTFQTLSSLKFQSTEISLAMFFF